MDLYLLTLAVIVLDAICIFMLNASHHPWALPSDYFLWAACVTALSAILVILLACIVLQIIG